MRFYESVFIARQDISTGQVETLCDEFAGIVTGGGGKILKQEYWGLKTLQYRIKKNRKGHYVLFNIEADAATMDEYGRKLGLNEDIIRVLTVKVDTVDDEPSIMMQAKSDHLPLDDLPIDEMPGEEVLEKASPEESADDESTDDESASDESDSADTTEEGK